MFCRQGGVVIPGSPGEFANGIPRDSRPDFTGRSMSCSLGRDEEPSNPVVLTGSRTLGLSTTRAERRNPNQPS